MSGEQDGGQAFPSEFFETEHGDRVRAYDGRAGMTLRDWFAGQALSGLITALTEGEHETINEAATACADAAYVMADALLAERSK